MLFLPLGLFYKTMGLLDEVNYNNNNSYNLSTINTGCGLVAGGRGTEATVRISGNLVGISINLCKSIQKELFINDTP